MISGLRLFKTAFANTRRQVYVSGLLLVAFTCVLSFVLYLAESSVNPNFSFWDAFIWPYEKYVGDPGKVVDEPLISPIAKIVGTLVGIMGVAIFAVPAGLIGSGLTDAMDEEKREQELQGFRQRMRKAFRRQSDKTLREYLNQQPDGGGTHFKILNFVPQRVKVAKMQVRQGMDMKDIFDTCCKFPEFRLKNLADVQSAENEIEDRFVVEHFPQGTSYGCCIDRGSHVTIVCTGSFDELGIGWFTYYLAKMGGFNYVSKEVEVDPDELDSFYNYSKEPLYDKKPLSYYGAGCPLNKAVVNRAIAVLGKKEKHRTDFLDDINRLLKDDDAWVIIVTEHLKNSANQIDFHFADTLNDVTASTVSNQKTYQQFCQQFASTMSEKFGLSSQMRSTRYPLMKKNLGYTIRLTHPEANVFVLRPSSELINFDTKKLVYAYEMARLISQQLDGGRGMSEQSHEDFKETGFGYKENNA